MVEETIPDKVKSLFSKKKEKIFPRKELIELLGGDFLPSDYCYNNINKYTSSFKLPVFEKIGRGKYKCLGLNYPYTGIITWKNKQGKIEQVGEWVNGEPKLWKDPRINDDNIAHEDTQLAHIQKIVEVENYFNPDSIEDARERIEKSIVQRRGQYKFRKELLKAYEGRCAITRSNAEKALESAHISPYKGEETNHVCNGLLLRADIHTLFDLNEITIHPKTKRVCLSPELKKSSYKELDNQDIALPKNQALHPSDEAIRWHYSQCSWAQK